MHPLIKVLIILSVSILLGILIIPRLSKRRFRIERGVVQTHTLTKHKTKNIVIIIAMSVLMVGGLLALVWQQVGEKAKAAAVQVVQTKLDTKETELDNTTALKNAEDARDAKVIGYIQEMGQLCGRNNYCSTAPGVKSARQGGTNIPNYSGPDPRSGSGYHDFIASVFEPPNPSNADATKWVQDTKNVPPPAGCKAVVGEIKVSTSSDLVAIETKRVNFSWAPSDFCQAYFDNPTSKCGWTAAQKKEIDPLNQAVINAGGVDPNC